MRTVSQTVRVINRKLKMNSHRLVLLPLFCYLVVCLATAEVAPIDPEAPVVSGKNHGDEKAEVDSNVVVGKGFAGGDDSVKKSAVDDDDSKGWMGVSGSFGHGFIATLSVIIVSELGDKTFFIAAIMAMRHPRKTVLAGAMSALALMHVMSAFFGYAITIIPRVVTFYLSSLLFAIFGLKMLREGWKMSPQEAQEELEEVQEDLRKREADVDAADMEAGQGSSASSSKPGANIIYLLFSRIFLQAFTMTFLAEWGDRSQLATIVLAARENVAAVVIAGIIGHGICTGLAVLGGRMIAQRISVRTVTIVGGVVFLVFAVTALFMDPEGN